MTADAKAGSLLAAITSTFSTVFGVITVGGLLETLLLAALSGAIGFYVTKFFRWLHGDTKKIKKTHKKAE